MRALIAGIVHESSTFVLQVTGPTVLEDFEVHAGPDLIKAFEGTNTVIGGYLAACGLLGVTVAPTLHARAEPGAAVDPAAYQVLERQVLDLTEAAGKADLILLDLHGAGTLVSGESLDLALVRALRALAGPDAVLGMTLDLHANLPSELVGLTDVLVGFQEYPHIDMASRAEVTAGLAIATARRRLRPVVRKLGLPMLLPPSTTLSGPAAEVRELVREQENAEGVLACTVFHGFPYVGTEHASASVVTVANDSAALADEVNGRIGKWLWDNKDRFLIRAITPEQAVTDALASGRRPVVIGDGTDNPGSGAPGDSTYLLRALLDTGARACLATLHDPAAVVAAAAAGAGAQIDVAVGGRHGWASGPAVPVHATVRSITDGRVIQQNMRRGKLLEFGLSARLEAGRVDIIVSSMRRQVLDPEILILHGIVPQRYDVIAVKSVNHFRAGFAAISAGLLVADAPGPLTRDIITLHKDGPTAALWPINAACPARRALNSPCS